MKSSALGNEQRVSLLIIPKSDEDKSSSMLPSKRVNQDESEVVETKKQKMDESEYLPEIDDEDLDNEPEVPEKVYLEPIVQDTTPRTRRQLEAPPTGRDKIECPFCKKTSIRRGIVQHVSHSHPDQYKKFRRSAAYTKILPLFCASCKMRFAGNESFRKHFQDSSCKKPDKTAENLLSKEQEIKYKCPSGCNFFGPLRLILTHMYQHPEANVKLRLRKSKLLPVKCEECSFHYTTRASLSKHIEKKRCIKNKEHVRYAELKMKRRQERKLKKDSPVKPGGKVIDIEVVKSNETSFLRCPFNCGRMYTSKEKLTKHVVEAHDVEVVRDQSSVVPEKQVPEQVNVGSLVQSLFRTDCGKIMCPIEKCQTVVPADQYSRLAAHCRKSHTRNEYLVFRSTPTNEAPYVCQNCSWSFTKQQITNHFQREGRTVCVRNKKWLDELKKCNQPLPKLFFGNKGKVVDEPLVSTNTDSENNKLEEGDVHLENSGPLEQIMNKSNDEDKKEPKDEPEDLPLEAASQSTEVVLTPVDDIEPLDESAAENPVQTDAKVTENQLSEKPSPLSSPDRSPSLDAIDKPCSLEESNQNTTSESQSTDTLPTSNIDSVPVVASSESSLLDKTIGDLIGPADDDILTGIDIALPDEKSEHPIIKVESEFEVQDVQSEDTIEEIPLDDENDEDDDPIDQLLMRAESRAISFDKPLRDLHELLLRTLNKNVEAYQFKCSFCLFRSCRVEDLFEHIKYSHKTSNFVRYLARSRYSQYQCSNCGIRSNSKTWITAHMSTEQRAACHRFDYIRKQFKVKLQPEDKLVISESSSLAHTRIYKCPKCPKTYNDLLGGMLDHLAFAHGIESYINVRMTGDQDLKIKCQKCSWYFHQNLDNHSHIECQLYQAISAKQTADESSSERSKHIQCPLCKKDSKNVYELLGHIYSEHAEYNTVYRLKKSDLLQFKCPSCYFYFPTIDMLQHHRKLPGECQRNYNERQRLILGLELCQNSAGTNSPNLSGRDSRMSYNSDQNDSAYHPSPADIFTHYSPQPKKNIPFQQLSQPSMQMAQQIGVPNSQMLQSQYFSGQPMVNYQQAAHLQKKSHLDNFPVSFHPYASENQVVQFQQHQFMSQKTFIDMNKDRFLVQVSQPNNFELGTVSTCSYCFMPMKTKEDVQRHAHQHQECTLGNFQMSTNLFSSFSCSNNAL